MVTMEEHLKRMNKVHNKINKLNIPALRYQEEIARIGKIMAPVALQYQEHLSQISNSITSNLPQYQDQIFKIYQSLEPALMQIQTFQQSLEPLRISIAQQQSFLKQLELPSSLSNQIGEVFSSTSKILDLPQDKDVPNLDVKLEVLEKAAYEVSDLAEITGIDLQATEDVSLPQNEIKLENINWEKIARATLRIIWFLISFIAIYSQFMENAEQIIEKLASIFHD
jgi:hypothetical protein